MSKQNIIVWTSSLTMRETLVCKCCGERQEIEYGYDIGSRSANTISIVNFILAHNNCKKKKQINYGDEVYNLNGNYLGTVRSINKREKTALVKDSARYKMIHKISELIPAKK